MPEEEPPAKKPRNNPAHRGRKPAVPFEFIRSAIENGVVDLTILAKIAGYKSPSLLNQRIKRTDRSLLKKLKIKGASRSYPPETEALFGKLLKATNERFKVNAQKALVHDMDLKSRAVNAERRRKKLDSHYKMRPVIESAAEFKNLLQSAQIAGGLGVEPPASSKVEVTTNMTHNHATLLRANDVSLLLQDPNTLPLDCFVSE